MKKIKNPEPSSAWQTALLQQGATLEDAILNLDKSAMKIALVVDGNGILQGTISDGDIRRALIKGTSLNNSIEGVIHRNALVVPMQMELEMVKRLMNANKIHQIPIVDQAGRVVGLHLWDEVLAPSCRDNVFVVMAGGKGERLRPHTEKCPKPLLPVAGKPMLEHIVDRAKGEGFTRFIFAVHYLGDMIEEYFGDGNRFGVSISYIRENAPLGTAGALSLLELKEDQPLVVTNGDVITDIRYSEMLDYHLRHDAVATMAVRLHEWQHPFGVVLTDGVDIVGFEEKPIHRSHINAGIYVLDPCALELLDKNEHCDMPSLFEKIRNQQKKKTVVYPMHEPWLDVGHKNEYETLK